MVVVVRWRSSRSQRLIYTYTFCVYSQVFSLALQIIGQIRIRFDLNRTAPEYYRSILWRTVLTPGGKKPHL
jgi:hypothetical protein